MRLRKTVLILLALATVMLCGDAALEAVMPASLSPDEAPEASAPVSQSPGQAASGPAPASTPAPAGDPLKALIADMSPRQLIGQMVMIGFAGRTDMSGEAKAIMQQYCIGNIILFGQNVTRFAQAKNLIEAVNRQNAVPRIPLNVCIDIEGGDVTRFRYQWRPFIRGAAALGKANDTQRVFEQYTQIGATLKDMGFTLNLAPVADIAPNPGATFMGTRMFGSDAQKVAPLVREAVKGLHNGGVASMVKHFPGHGETATDSHASLPVIRSTRERLESYALVPFAAALEAGADAVLVGHLSLPEVDPEIASVSRGIITGILRESLGFDGVVMSDDMRMAGITRTYKAGEAAVRFVEAGGDIVLIGKQVDKQRDVCDSLYAAYESGRLTRARLEQSAERVLRMKQKWCGLVLE